MGWNSHTGWALTHLILPQVNDAANPTIAFGDGDTGLYESASNTLAMAFGGVAKWQFDAGALKSLTDGGPGLLDEAATATNPSIMPNENDSDTGIGAAALDQLSLIAGAIEGMRITEASSVAYPTFGGNVNAQALEIRVATTLESGMTGATVTATNLIPAASLVLGVTIRVTTAIEGGDNFDVGDGADVDAWGAGIAYTVNTTTTIADFVATGPLFYPSTTSVVLTQNGAGTFSAGACRITVHYIGLTAATS